MAEGHPAGDLSAFFRTLKYAPHSAGVSRQGRAPAVNFPKIMRCAEDDMVSRNADLCDMPALHHLCPDAHRVG